MTGVIWVVRLILYPAFASIADSKTAEFHRMHSNRISWIVGPLMLVELASAAALAAFASPRWLWSLNVVGVGAIWASTAFSMVPAHERLAQGFTPALVRKLVAGNWPRTCVWTARLIAIAAATAAAAAA